MLRTVQLIGGAYCLDGNLEAVVKINNNIVYSGPIDNSTKTAVPESNFTKEDVLASWDYDFEFVYGAISPNDATVNLSIEINGGDSFSGISFAGLKINWHMSPAVDLANKKYYSRGADFFWYPGKINYQTDGKTNVQIDGADQMWRRTNDRVGMYHWPLYSGSTLTCTVDVRATITPDNSFTLELDSDANEVERLALPIDVTEAYNYVKEIHDQCKNANRCLAQENGKSSDCPSIGLCCLSIPPIAN